MREIEDIANLLNAQEVKKILRVSLPTVYNLADRGQIPCVRWECPASNGKRPKTTVRFKRQDIIDFIDKFYRATSF